MFKDPDKQREANRKASKKYRDNKTGKGMTVADEPSNVIPKTNIRVIPSDPPILEPKVKRGKDIKCFADLPADIQETIWSLSRRDGKVDPIEVANRAAIAINYQHQFPDRYHSTGI